MDVPFPPPRMVRLLDLESACKCSRSDGLEMRNPKVTLKSQIGHLEPVLGPVEKSKNLKIWGFWLAECSLFFQKKCFKMDPTSILQPSKHQTQRFQTVFQSTKIIRGPSKGGWVQIRKIQDLTKLNSNSFHCYPRHLRSGWIWRQALQNWILSAFLDSWMVVRHQGMVWERSEKIDYPRHFTFELHTQRPGGSASRTLRGPTCT